MASHYGTSGRGSTRAQRGGLATEEAARPAALDLELKRASRAQHQPRARSRSPNSLTSHRAGECRSCVEGVRTISPHAVGKTAAFPRLLALQHTGDLLAAGDPRTSRRAASRRRRYSKVRTDTATAEPRPERRWPTSLAQPAKAASHGWSELMLRLASAGGPGRPLGRMPANAAVMSARSASPPAPNADACLTSRGVNGG